jgi:hypothetical protein
MDDVTLKDLIKEHWWLSRSHFHIMVDGEEYGGEDYVTCACPSIEVLAEINKDRVLVASAVGSENPGCILAADPEFFDKLDTSLALCHDSAIYLNNNPKDKRLLNNFKIVMP